MTDYKKYILKIVTWFSFDDKIKIEDFDHDKILIDEKS